VDSEQDLRAEMLSTMGEMGLPIEKHHHEVAQSQHELGTKFGPLVQQADFMQIYKYCVHMHTIFFYTGEYTCEVLGYNLTSLISLPLAS
jgi:glutamine synthetase